MFWKSTSFQTYLLIAIALGAASLLAVPLVEVARSTDSASACWNANGTIDEDTGACVLPKTQCPPGTVVDPAFGPGGQCLPIAMPRTEAEQGG